MPIKGTNNRYDVYDNGDSVTMIRNDNTEDSPYNPNMIEFQKPTESTTKPGTYDGVSEYRHNLLVNNLTDTNLDRYTPSGNPAVSTGAPGEASAVQRFQPDRRVQLLGDTAHLYFAVSGSDRRAAFADSEPAGFQL